MDNKKIFAILTHAEEEAKEHLHNMVMFEKPQSEAPENPLENITVSRVTSDKVIKDSTFYYHLSKLRECIAVIEAIKTDGVVEIRDLARFL